MSDKELLELAARAAGYKVLGLASKWIAQGVSEHALLYRNERGGDSVFDPLTDPGDALRLAVQLDISVMQPAPEDNGNVLALWPRGEGVSEPRLSNRLAATMRAIVRAAAEIGRRMPE